MAVYMKLSDINGLLYYAGTRLIGYVDVTQLMSVAYLIEIRKIKPTSSSAKVMNRDIILSYKQFIKFLKLYNKDLRKHTDYKHKLRKIPEIKALLKTKQAVIVRFS